MNLIIIKSFSSSLAILFVAILACCCFIATNSSETSLGGRVFSNVNLHTNTNTETVKINNTKTKNYHITQSHYQPTQYNQLIFQDAPKAKKLRRTRPVTFEEAAIKQRIQDVYEAARDEFNNQSSPHFDLLGRIVNALNPKYIATFRLRQVAYADALNPEAKVDLPVPLELPQVAPLELSADKPATIADQLDALATKFGKFVLWDEGFVEKLANSANEELSPAQIAFKRLIMCLSGQTNSCDPLHEQPELEEQQQQADNQPQPESEMIDTSPSEINEIYDALPGQDVDNMTEPFDHTEAPELSGEQNRLVQDDEYAREANQPAITDGNSGKPWYSGWMDGLAERLFKRFNTRSFKPKGQPRPFVDTKPT